jgi:thiamine pyrophosphokinase
LGFLGGRRDHEFATILEVVSFARDPSFRGEIIWEDGIIRCVKGQHEFTHQGLFSIFSFLEDTQVSVSGAVKYQVSQSIKAYSSHGLSNEADGCFTIQSNQPVLVYFV